MLDELFQEFGPNDQIPAIYVDTLVFASIWGHRDSLDIYLVDLIIHFEFP